MNKNIVLLGDYFIFIIGCQQTEVIKTHGIAYLRKQREVNVTVNKSNKNDAIAIFRSTCNKRYGMMIICGYILREQELGENY